jgi:trimeric autotransporter adhesin
MKLLKRIAVLLLAGLFAGNAQEIYVTTLNGNNQVPPSTLSTATGSGLLILNPDQSLTYNIAYTNLTGSFAVAHIHGPAGPGTNAGVVFPLNNVATTSTSGTLLGTTVPLDGTQLGYLRGGLLYVNIHSAPSYLAGEIRGQIDPFSVFTYQGRLQSGTNPVTGLFDLQFAVYDSPAGGTQLGVTAAATATSVSDGLFTVTLNVGGGVFTGANRWLEIGVRTNGGGAFVTLTPRQPITPAPYAVMAGTVAGIIPGASLAGTYSSAVTFNNAANSFSGSYSGNGGNLTNVNALRLGGLTVSNFWRTDGNGGTTPGAHFVGTTDNQALEFKVNNLRALRIEPNASGLVNVIGGATNNLVASGASAATIGGGYSHTIEAGTDGSTIAGGFLNTIQANAERATIGGGQVNVVHTNADWAVIAGGFNNDIGSNSLRSTIGGGFDNNIGNSSSSVFIGGGTANDIGNSATTATIAGGANNNIGNSSSSATISGGGSNDIGTNSNHSSIGGGSDNNIAALSSYATIAGGVFNDIGVNSDFNTVGGGSDNDIADNTQYSTISGGWLNQIGTNGIYNTIGGGYQNRIAESLQYSLIDGGVQNRIGSNCFAVVIGGGVLNRITNDTASALIAGGSGNIIGRNSGAGTIGGGLDNLIVDNGEYATIPGGRANVATNYAFAAGRGARAVHTGAFVWADSTVFDISSTNANSMTLRASGGYRLFSNDSESAGVYLAPGGTSWAVLSDRNAKKDFAPVDSRAVLEKLAGLPTRQWRYLWDAADATPHLGPMAQEFKAAFYPGRDDRTITTLEFDGVELAAIQGLNQKLEQQIADQSAQLRERDARIAALEKTVADLKDLIVRAPSHQQK